jgi:hypothetical protein
MQNDRGDVITFKHGMAEIEPGLRLHYVEAGEGERTVVLQRTGLLKRIPSSLSTAYCLFSVLDGSIVSKGVGWWALRR